MHSVVVAGATGAVGREVVTRLVADSRVARVAILSRHQVPRSKWRHFFPNLNMKLAAAKLSAHGIDWDRVEVVLAKPPDPPATDSTTPQEGQQAAAESSEKVGGGTELFQVGDTSLTEHRDFYSLVFSGHDTAVSCLGTSSIHEMFTYSHMRSIDVRINKLFAEAVAANNNASDVHFSLLSSLGANPDSFCPYFRGKGDAEYAVAEVGFKSLSVWRPGVLTQRKDRSSRSIFEMALGRMLPNVSIPAMGSAMAAEVHSPQNVAAFASLTLRDVRGTKLVNIYGSRAINLASERFGGGPSKIGRKPKQ